MRDSTKSIEAFISQDLHGLLFLEEFVFAKNRLTLPKQGEIEFADAVVLLGDTLLVYQFN
jgi:hypothetical protein